MKSIYAFLFFLGLLAGFYQTNAQGALVKKRSIAANVSINEDSLKYIKVDPLKIKTFVKDLDSIKQDQFKTVISGQKVGGSDNTFQMYLRMIKGKNKRYAFIVHDLRSTTNPVFIIHRNKRGYNQYLKGNFIGRPHIAILQIMTDEQRESWEQKSPDPLTVIRVDYEQSFAKKSLKDLIALASALDVPAPLVAAKGVNIQFIELNQKRIIGPCKILDSLNADNHPKTSVHESNMINFQVGLANTHFTRNDFSISGGNLVVTPDTAQQKAWKSNLFAMVELHAPRDIDNFQPLWNVLFKNPYAYQKQNKPGSTKQRPGIALLNKLYNLTLDRVGVYGGVGLSKDPLADLHFGFNYAITKELYFTLGWKWTNQIAPQVTSIGSITSLSDAELYATRKYSKPQFSWGLSFSPAAVVTMLGLGKKN